MQATVAVQPVLRPRLKRPSWLRPGLLLFAFDLLAPTGLTYLLLWRGTSLYVALLASASLSAVFTLASYLRGRGSGRFAPYMLALSIASFCIALVTGSERFLLAKESLLTAMVGCWFFGSLWGPRPLAYQFARPLLEGRFVTGGAAWEILWAQEPRFRRIWRNASVMWAVATWLDAALRVVMAYTLPVHAVPALQSALLIATSSLMQVVTGIYYSRAGLWTLVRAEGTSGDRTLSGATAERPAAVATEEGAR